MTATMKQPGFDSRLLNLAYPLEGKSFGNLRRGYMQWEKAPVGGLNKKDARVNFLYNPATVTADFAMNYAYSGALQFPVPGDQSILRVPLSQTATFSLLYDRTYELWGSYKSDGHPRRKGAANDPATVGCMADIYQMQQFTGMTINYSTNGTLSTSLSNTSFNGHQGILQLIPSFVHFGTGNVLGFYGYISEWSYQVTHFTQKMVPMRCVIDISWTMLPYTPTTTGTPNTGPGLPGNGPRGPIGGPLPKASNGR
jgi:hypothetical protein